MVKSSQSKEIKNIKFVAVARATDKLILCAKVPKGTSQNMPKCREMFNQVLSAPTWNEQVEPNGQHSLVCDHDQFHFTMDEEHRVYATLTTSTYPARVAFQMLSALRTEIKQHHDQKSLTCKEGGLKDSVMKTLNQLIHQFDDPAKNDKIAQVSHKVENVKIVMQDNIQSILANTEKIESVEEKTNHLNEQAKVFRSQGRQLQRKMWYKNFKLNIAIGLAVILVIIIILAMAGAFDSSGSVSSGDQATAAVRRGV